MSFGRPGNLVDSFNVSPPERGSFPLDHDHECSSVMKEYLACLKANQQKNEKCRMLSKKYLQCRFDAGLMEKTEWRNLGYPDTPSAVVPATTESTSTTTTTGPATGSLPTPPRGESGPPTQFAPVPLPESVKDGAKADGVATGAGPTGVLGGSKGSGV